MDIPESINCPTCSSTANPGWVVNNPDWPSGAGERFIECPTCEGSLTVATNDLPDGLQLYEVGINTIYSDIVYVAATDAADADVQARRVDIDATVAGICSTAEIVDIKCLTPELAE